MPTIPGPGIDSLQLVETVSHSSVYYALAEEELLPLPRRRS